MFRRGICGHGDVLKRVREGGHSRMLLDLDAEPTETRCTFEDICENDKCVRTVVFDQARFDAFIELTDDRALVHVDEVHAKEMGYPKIIAHGLLVASSYSRMLGMFLPGPNSVIQSIRLDILQPVFLGDIVRFEVVVVRKVASVKAVKLSLAAFNQHDVTVGRGAAQCLFPK